MSDVSEEEDTIHLATIRGDLELVRHLVEIKGVDVESRNRDEWTPLIVGVYSTDPSALPVVRYLISQNANVDAVVPEGGKFPGCTALMVSSTRGNSLACQILLKEGNAKVNYINCKNDETALTMAAKSQEGLHLIPTLIAHGANVNPSDAVLTNACYFQHASVVQQLLECGANTEAKGGDGTTALQVAVQHSDEATVRLLVARGAKVNPPGYQLILSPVLLAARRGEVDVLQSVLEHDASLGVLVENGLSLLCYLEDRTYAVGILLNHCQTTMEEETFVKCLLQPNGSGNIGLHRCQTAGMAKALVEQPRRQNTHQLLPVCRDQLVRKNAKGMTPVDELKLLRGSYGLRRDAEKLLYLETFELVLSIPGHAKKACDDLGVMTKSRKLNDCIAVKLNPALNDFQRSVGQEALQLIMDTMNSPDSIAHAILGYLSPLDVMKRAAD